MGGPAVARDVPATASVQAGHTPLTVAVLSGGRSSERDVSVASRPSVLEGLSDAGYAPVSIEVDREGVWRREGEVVALTPGRGLEGVDVVFPLLIGAFGEDGTVQGLLECLRIPYVGAGVLASALCLDKLRFKALMAEAGIPQTCHRVMYEDRVKDEPDVVIDELARLTFPLFVKPASSGSSLGVTRAASPAELRESLAQAFDFGPVAIVEVAGGPCEVECSVIGNASPFASAPGEVAVVSSRSGWRDHETKSTSGSINLFVPARISERALAEVHRLSLLAFEATGCCGLARVDFFVDGDRVLLNEVNTMPGLMKLSVFPLMLEASGVTYTEMIDRLVRLALERHARAPSSRI